MSPTFRFQKTWCHDVKRALMCIARGDIPCRWRVPAPGHADQILPELRNERLDCPPAFDRVAMHGIFARGCKARFHNSEMCHSPGKFISLGQSQRPLNSITRELTAFAPVRHEVAQD